MYHLSEPRRAWYVARMRKAGVSARRLIVGIGLSRVYLGIHYPSDVIAAYLSAAFVIGAVLAFSPGWS